MASDRKIVLVSGANSGIGYELVRQLLQKANTHVLLGSRSVSKGEVAVDTLKALNLPGTVSLLPLDVSSFSSVTAAAKRVQEDYGYLSHLVNNAGIASPPPGNENMPLHENMDLCFRTNATGTQMMGDAFAPLLLKAPTGMRPARIVNVSSGAGSITRRMDSNSKSYKMGAVHYRASKAAMNMVSACMSVQYEEEGVKVFAFCPGFTASNLSEMNNEENGAKPVEEGVRPIVDILEGKRDGESGSFLFEGGVYPW